MMSLEAIRELSRERAEEAEELGLEPYCLEYGFSDDEVRHIPFIGEYVPDGWERTSKTYFVDASGFGRPGEPALTFEQFCREVEPGYGYAITESGQFQVHIRQYRRTL